MADFKILFQNPWLLLLIIPILILTLVPFFKIPKRFRRTRNRVISVTCHILAGMLCVALVAGIGFKFTVPNRENQIMLVVDCSDSNTEQKQLKEQYMQNVLNMCDDGVKVGVVTFGNNAIYAVELTDNYRDVYPQYLASLSPATSSAKVDTTATNISNALKFASEKFFNQKTAKIVLLSDGYETDENAANTAQMIAARGVKIDVVSFANQSSNEIQITDVQMPQSKVMLGAETELTLTIQSTVENNDVALTIADKGTSGNPIDIEVKTGIQTVKVMHKFNSAGLHDMLFTISVEDGVDNISQNNVYQTYLDISMFENILILESKEGEADRLESILMQNGVDVTVVNLTSQPDLVPKNAKELSEYQQVILVNIANSDLVADTMPENFDGELYKYVYSLGGSMFTVGGECDIGEGGASVPHAYNTEDMAGTLYQQMLPVQAIDYNPPVAVMVVVDISGSMGPFENSKLCAEAVFSQLQDRDYGGVMSFSTSSKEEATIIEMSRRNELFDALDRLQNQQGSGSGGTIFADPIEIAGQALSMVDVDRKHIILITDGDPFDKLGEEGAGFVQGNYGWAIEQNLKNDITMSVITIDMGADKEQQMIDTVERGEGNLYKVTSDNMAVVGGYMSEEFAEIKLSAMAEVVFTPTIGDHTSVFDGISTENDKIPELGGYYGTRLKDGAEVPLIYKYVPIYASWSFGKGKVGSFMSTLSGDSWSADFVDDPIGQLLVWNICQSLAPLSTLEPGSLDFVVKESIDNYSNRLDIYTDLAEGQTVSVTVDPASDGAGYVDVQASGNNITFNFDIELTGLYKILIQKLDVDGTVLSEMTMYRAFSYSEEYNAFREDDGEEILADIAVSGNGVVVSDPVDIFATFEPRIQRDYDPAMIFLIIAMVCILIDVAVRKFKFKWIHEIIRERKQNEQQNASNTQGENLK